MKKLEGVIPALAAPFKDGAFDEDAYRKLIRYNLDGGVSGLVPCGTTGEAVTMTAEERNRAIKIAVDASGGKVPVIAGCGSNSTAETIESVKRAREVGADATLIVTPYYNKPTQAGLYEHFRAIARAHPGFPIVAYNVPGRTGVDLLPETCQRLCELPEVVALKEATGNLARLVDILEKCGDRLSLLSGDDFTIHPFCASGGRGVISVSANVAPKLVTDLVNLSRKGDNASATELQIRLNNLHRLLFVESNPIPVKWGLHLLGLFGPEVRLPLTQMTEANGKKLGEELKKLGLL